MVLTIENDLLIEIQKYKIAELSFVVRASSLLYDLERAHCHIHQAFPSVVFPRVK